METVENPIFSWNGHHGLPEFGKMDDDAFAPAFEAALERHSREIDAIAADPRDPDFNNTIVALEIAGRDLSRASALFWNRAGGRQ